MNILPDIDYTYASGNQGITSSLEQISILTSKHRPLTDYMLNAASASRTVATTFNTFCTLGSKGITVFVNVTASSTLLGIYPVIDFTTDLAGTLGYSTAYSASPLVCIATGLYSFTFYPSLVATATAFSSYTNFVLPLFARIRIIANDANAVTYSVNACLLP